MDLILWRHAKPEPGEPDLGRRLTSKGLKQAERMAAWLERAPARYHAASWCRPPTARSRPRSRCSASSGRCTEFAPGATVAAGARRGRTGPIRASRCWSSGISRRSGWSRRSCCRAKKRTGRCAEGRRLVVVPIACATAARPSQLKTVVSPDFPIPAPAFARYAAHPAPGPPFMGRAATRGESRWPIRSYTSSLTTHDLPKAKQFYCAAVRLAAGSDHADGRRQELHDDQRRRRHRRRHDDRARSRHSPALVAVRRRRRHRGVDQARQGSWARR